MKTEEEKIRARESQRRYRATHLEKVREATRKAQKRYYDLNRDKCIEAVRKSENKAAIKKIKEKQAWSNFYRNHRDRIKKTPTI